MSVQPEKYNAKNDHTVRRKGARRAGPTFPGGPTLGDTFWESDTQILWVWNGTVWVIIGPLQDNSVTAAKIPLGTIPENRLDAALQTKINRAVESPQINLTMQADSVVATSDNPNGFITVNYPVAFGAAPQCIVLTNGEDGQGVFFFSLVFRNAGSFTARLRHTNGTIATGFLVRMNWIACLP